MGITNSKYYWSLSGIYPTTESETHRKYFKIDLSYLDLDYDVYMAFNSVSVEHLKSDDEDEDSIQDKAWKYMYLFVVPKDFTDFENNFAEKVSFQKSMNAESQEDVAKVSIITYIKEALCK